MDRGKIAIGASVVTFCGLMAATVALSVGSLQAYSDGMSASSSDANASVSVSATSNSSAAQTAMTMEQWGELYPLEYNSYHTSTIWGDGRYHGHYDLKQQMLAPVVRKVRPDGQLDTKLVVNGNESEYDKDGYYYISGLEYDSSTHQWVVDEDELGDLSGTRERVGCFACKSSVFDTVYEADGAAVFTEKMSDQFVDQLNGQIWDCATCHDADDASSEADAGITSYWSQLARDTYDTFTPEERACGQCHNSLDYRSHITDQETMDSFSPYRYGLDIDSLYQAAIEDGIGTLDEDTGIVVACLDHPDLEFNSSSPMHALGVTCVDCHMPEVTDPETGQTYRDHNASGSPLENEASLEYCLTCHKSQGIETTEDMKAMVRGLQAETAVKEYALEDEFNQAYELIKDANLNGGVDEDTLQQARDDFSVAESYFHAVSGVPYNTKYDHSKSYGVRIAHNPTATADYLARCGQLLDGVVASLS